MFADGAVLALRGAMQERNLGRARRGEWEERRVGGEESGRSGDGEVEVEIAITCAE
jgi:hypothetical protein